MVTIQPNSTKTERYTGTFNALAINLNVSASVVNTALVNSDIQLKNITVKVELLRNGQLHQIMSASLDILGAASGYNDATFYSNAIGSTNRYNILVAAAAGVKEVATVPFLIPFSLQKDAKGNPLNGHVNCNDSVNDYLQLTIIGTPGMFSTNIDSATSNMTVTLINSIGLEYATPKIEQTVINANVDSQTFDLGEMVQVVRFVNTDKTLITNAHAVLSMVNVSSDKITVNGTTYEQLLNNRANAFVNKTEANARCQTFEIVNELTPLQKCRLDLSFNDTNVNSSSNYVVVGRYVKNPIKAIQSSEKAILHTLENRQVLGLPNKAVAL